MDAEEYEHLLALRSEYIKRRRVLELQAVRFGSYVPAHIQVEINDIDNNIQWIDEQLFPPLSLDIVPVENKRKPKKPQGRFGRFVKNLTLEILIYIVTIVFCSTIVFIIAFISAFIGYRIDTAIHSEIFVYIFYFVPIVIYLLLLFFTTSFDKYLEIIENKIASYIFNKFG